MGRPDREWRQLERLTKPQMVTPQTEKRKATLEAAFLTYSIYLLWTRCVDRGLDQYLYCTVVVTTLW
jgi:hypothetical protein